MEREQQVSRVFRMCAEQNTELDDAQDVVGNATVSDVVRFTCEGHPADQLSKSVRGGVDIEFLAAVTIVAAVVVTIKNLFDIYDHCVEKLGRKPTQEEFTPIAKAELERLPPGQPAPVSNDIVISLVWQDRELNTPPQNS